MLTITWKSTIIRFCNQKNSNA